MGGQEKRVKEDKKEEGQAQRVREKEVRGISRPTSIYVLNTQETHEQGVYSPSGNMKTTHQTCEQAIARRFKYQTA